MTTKDAWRVVRWVYTLAVIGMGLWIAGTIVAGMLAGTQYVNSILP